MSLIGSEIDRLVGDYQRRFDAGEISPNTLRSAKYNLQILKRHFGNLTCSVISKDLWQEFQTEFDRTVGGTQFNLTKIFSVFCRWLHEKGLLDKKPVIKNQFATRERNARRRAKDWLYSREEVISLEVACLTDKERLAILLGSLTAFRVSDVVSLSWDRIVIEGSRSYVDFKGADDKAHFIGKCPIPEKIVEILLRLPRESQWVYPQSRNPDKHLLPQQFPYNAIKKRAGISKGGFHSLRRFALSRDFKNTSLTPALVCKTRRISMAVAMDAYIRTNDEDLDLVNKQTK